MTAMARVQVGQDRARLIPALIRSPRGKLRHFINYLNTKGNSVRMSAGLIKSFVRKDDYQMKTTLIFIFDLRRMRLSNM